MCVGEGWVQVLVGDGLLQILMSARKTVASASTVNVLTLRVVTDATVTLDINSRQMALFASVCL